MLRSSAFAIALILTLMYSAAPASAQKVFGVGYVANAPQSLIGGAVYALMPVGSLGRWGLYVDAKFDATPRTNEEGFLEDMTAVDAELAGDAFFSEDQGWQTINVAIMREFTDELTAYAGAGHSERTVYSEYFDDAREQGRFGFYWVEDEELSGTEVNFLAGVLLQISNRVFVHAGAESAPVGATIGLSYQFGVGR